MNCEKLKQLLPDFLSDCLDETTRKQVDDHISGCEKCKIEVERFETTWAKLEQFPELEPGPEVENRFYTMLEAYKHGMAHNHAKLSWSNRLGELLEACWPRRPAYQFAIALLFLVSGLTAGRFMGTGQGPNNEMVEMKKEIQDMRQMVTLSLLNQSSAIERLQGLTMSSNVKNPDEEFLSLLVLTLNSDPNINVRLAAIDALRHFSNNEWARTELVRSLGRQTSPLVQVGLIDLMVELKEQNSLETLRTVANDENTIDAVKQRAKWGINQLI